MPTSWRECFVTHTPTMLSRLPWITLMLKPKHILWTLFVLCCRPYVRPPWPSHSEQDHGLEGQGRFSGNGTPTDRSSGQIPLSLQMTSGPMASTYAAPVNPYNSMNNGFAPQFRGQYPQFSPAAHAHTLSNGSNNFMHFNPDNNQQSVQQSAPSFARMPQVNGGF